MTHRQLVSPMAAVSASRIIIFISALIAVTALLILTVTVQDQRDFNHCVSNLDSQWRRAVGLGLAAVADDDSQELQEQARIIRELSQEDC